MESIDSLSCSKEHGLDTKKFSLNPHTIFLFLTPVIMLSPNGFVDFASDRLPLGFSYCDAVNISHLPRRTTCFDLLVLIYFTILLAEDIKL